MGKKYFGTDGIRGIANSSTMNAHIAMLVGMAAGSYFTSGSHRHRVVIGKDTRLSGYTIENALTSGFLSVGMDVFLLGPIPTPAVAKLAPSLRSDLGVMISGSHNDAHYNGIKIFDKNGMKLSDNMEKIIEDRMNNNCEKFLVDANNLGRAKRLDDETGRYVEFVKSTFPKNLTLDNLKIVIDCANGAAYKVGPKILWELGADVISYGVCPDGNNINLNCGATNPMFLAQKVVEHQADLGIALDGDADRIIMCDKLGRVFDGDKIMAIIATMMHKNNMLNNNGVVLTHMSNLGLEHYLSNLGLDIYRCNVGDRYVLESMQQKFYNIGGEPSGHIILGDYSTTGDAMIAALQVISCILQEKKNLDDFYDIFKPTPQILRNITISKNIDEVEHLVKKDKMIKEITDKFSLEGKILIRKSGTESLLRVMVEGINGKNVIKVADQIEKHINDTIFQMS